MIRATLILAGTLAFTLAVDIEPAVAVALTIGAAGPIAFALRR